MRTNIATDSLQSQRLLHCGVSADTADMSWVVLSDDTETLTAIPNLAQSEVINYPAWSLSGLLRLIPHVIEVYDDGDYYFSLAQEFPASEDYHAAYKYCWADDDALVGKRSS